MGKNAVNIGQNYFHNVDLSEAKILIMKIIWTDIHGHYSHNVVKIVFWSVLASIMKKAKLQQPTKTRGDN